MAKFEIAIPKILGYEGGYVNHPKDPGGETNLGITDKLDGKIDHMVDVDGDGASDVAIRNLSIEDAKKIYKRVFWDDIKGDDIQSQHIATMLFDMAVNSGVSTAVRTIQRLVNVKVDGNIGPLTLSAINTADEKELYWAFKDARKDFYIDIVVSKPEKIVFLKGWINRLNSFVKL